MKNNPITIAPSIIAGDFGRLGDEAKKAEDGGADILHVDIMDGHFVPNITMGPQALAAINRSTHMFLDVHLMIYNPYDWIERFIESGADRLTFHLEATEDVEDTLNFIKKCNIEAGLAFNPETSKTMIPKYLDKCDLVNIMTVNPGFSGQQFISEMLEKIAFTKEMCEKLNVNTQIEVDGGVDEKTAPLCVEAGANVLVCGSYLYDMADMSVGVKELHRVTQTLTKER